jgi:hypothetical protein
LEKLLASTRSEGVERRFASGSGDDAEWSDPEVDGFIVGLLLTACRVVEDA